MSLDASVVLKQLLEIHKVTKWKISRDLQVSWQTVHSWSRGMFKPNEEHAKLLRSALEECDAKWKANRLSELERDVTPKGEEK